MLRQYIEREQNFTPYFKLVHDKWKTDKILRLIIK